MTRFKYFNNIQTLEQLRKEYKRLLKLHHPDNGGTKEASQTINNEYEALFKQLKDRHDSKGAADTTDSRAADNKSNMYDFESDKALREVLKKIIGFEQI